MHLNNKSTQLPTRLYETLFCVYPAVLCRRSSSNILEVAALCRLSCRSEVRACAMAAQRPVHCTTLLSAVY